LAQFRGEPHSNAIVFHLLVRHFIRIVRHLPSLKAAKKRDQGSRPGKGAGSTSPAGLCGFHGGGALLHLAGEVRRDAE
jgi:hypothetical protein